MAQNRAEEKSTLLQYLHSSVISLDSYLRLLRIVVASITAHNPLTLFYRGKLEEYLNKVFEESVPAFNTALSISEEMDYPLINELRGRILADKYLGESLIQLIKENIRRSMNEVHESVCGETGSYAANEAFCSTEVELLKSLGMGYLMAVIEPISKITSVFITIDSGTFVFNFIHPILYEKIIDSFLKSEEQEGTSIKLHIKENELNRITSYFLRYFILEECNGGRYYRGCEWLKNIKAKPHDYIFTKHILRFLTELTIHEASNKFEKFWKKVSGVLSWKYEELHETLEKITEEEEIPDDLKNVIETFSRLGGSSIEDLRKDLRSLGISLDKSKFKLQILKVLTKLLEPLSKEFFDCLEAESKKRGRKRIYWDTSALKGYLREGRYFEFLSGLSLLCNGIPVLSNLEVSDREIDLIAFVPDAEGILDLKERIREHGTGRAEFKNTNIFESYGFPAFNVVFIEVSRGGKQDDVINHLKGYCRIFSKPDSCENIPVLFLINMEKLLKSASKDFYHQTTRISLGSTEILVGSHRCKNGSTSISYVATDFINAFLNDHIAPLTIFTSELSRRPPSF